MSHRHAQWFREAEAKRPLYRVTCHKCDYVALTTDPELWKVAHQGDKHYGHPADFTQRKENGGSDAAS